VGDVMCSTCGRWMCPVSTCR